MNTNNILNKIITKVNGGMGRREKYDKSGKIFDRKVRMNGAYDFGGAYWGGGDNLRVQFNQDLSYIHFYRGVKL